MGQASGWEKWHDLNARLMRPTTERLVAAVGAAPGLRIVDVACGTGLPAIALAQRGAAVTATDASPEMVEATGRLAAAAGVTLDLRVADAQDLAGFDDASADAATCAFGLMFCDAVRAVKAMRRVVRPGGTIALAVWDVPAANPYFTTIFGALAQVVPPAAPPDPKTGMFRLGWPGELAAVLDAAGARDVAIEPCALMMEFPSIDEQWAMFTDMAPPLTAAATQLPAADFARIRATFEAALAPYVVDGRVRVPAQALIATCR